jgi:hypothetical protein
MLNFSLIVLAYLLLVLLALVRSYIRATHNKPFLGIKHGLARDSSGRLVRTETDIMEDPVYNRMWLGKTRYYLEAEYKGDNDDKQTK